MVLDDKEIVRYRLGTGSGNQFLQSSHRESLFYYEYALRQVRWYVLQLQQNKMVDIKFLHSLWLDFGE